MKLLKLIPASKDYLWGGENLKKDYNKTTDCSPLAESWELSVHPDGPSLIDHPDYKDTNFKQYIEQNPTLLGTNASKFPYFPILTKFIDAKQSLSIQVHPNDEYGQRVEKEFGKTEVWYILDAKEDAYIYYGTNKNITKEEMRQRIEDNTITDVLKKAPVKRGDIAFIEAGTIHAITEGIIILEIQQNSNSTYRVYDFARVGKDGKLRELHIDKAIDVSTLTPIENEVIPCVMTQNDGYQHGIVSYCDYFKVDRYLVDTKVTLTASDDSFIAITFIDGSATISANNETYECIKGDTFFAPANLGEVTISGQTEFITAKV